MPSQPSMYENGYADANAAINELLSFYRKEKRTSRITNPPALAIQCRQSHQADSTFDVAHSLPGQRPTALFSLPLELKEKVCASLDDEAALALLAQTCTFMSTFTEEFRFVNSIKVLSPRGLASFRTCLSNQIIDRFGRTRRQKVKSLMLSWTSGLPMSPNTAADLDWLLARLPKVASLHIELPPLHPLSVEGHFQALPLLSVENLPTLQTLSTTTSFARCLRGPVPSLTCMTLDLVRGSMDVGVYSVISAVFGETLRRLRLFRYFARSYSWQSPARICAVLQMHRLEYLEVRDDATMDDTGLTAVDTPGMPMIATLHLPALETLVWAPAWRFAYFDRIGDFEWAWRAYQCQLLAVLEPITLWLCVSDSRALMSWSEDGGTCYVAKELVDVDPDEWKNDS